jgi:RNA polymerase sigma-70 factor, ECF subfamily
MTATDARLVERAREGDSGAFEALVRRHYRPAFVAALGELGEASDAEDVCQDAFITALERLEECRDPDRFQAWLLRIVRNRARDIRRRRQVRLAQPLEAAWSTAGDSDPALDLQRSDLRDRLLAALARLPDVQRKVVLMYDLEGWPHREIAEQLELKEGTVRSHLSHGRRALRALLGTSTKEEADGTGTH